MFQYHKKPAAKVLLHTLEETLKNPEERVSTNVNEQLRDISYPHINTTPMWVGFYSNTIKDITEMQVVDYLSLINSSPTSYSVTQETLCYAQK